MNDKAEKLKKMLEMVNEGLTKKDFIDAFEKVVKLILQTQQKNAEEMEAMKQRHMELMHELERHSSSMSQEMKGRMMDYCEKEMEAMMKEHERMMAKMHKRMAEMKDGEDGKDADEKKIVQDVLSQIKLPEQKEVILDGPKEIRDKLETLQGNERLDSKAIKGLEDEIKSLRESISNIPRGKPMGRAKSQILRRIDLTSQVDGVASTFTLAPDVVDVMGVFSTQFPSGAWRPGVDWTFSGRTLTLETSQVGVPQSGQTLWILAEVLFYP